MGGSFLIIGPASRMRLWMGFGVVVVVMFACVGEDLVMFLWFRVLVGSVRILVG